MADTRPHPSLAHGRTTCALWVVDAGTPCSSRPTPCRAGPTSRARAPTCSEDPACAPPGVQHSEWRPSPSSPPPRPPRPRPSAWTPGRRPSHRRLDGRQGGDRLPQDRHPVTGDKVLVPGAGTVSPSSPCCHARTARRPPSRPGASARTSTSTPPRPPTRSPPARSTRSCSTSPAWSSWATTTPAPTPCRSSRATRTTSAGPVRADHAQGRREGADPALDRRCRAQGRQDPGRRLLRRGDRPLHRGRREDREDLARPQGPGQPRPLDKQVNADQAWAAGLKGAGTKVAVLDTGADAEHPDLQGRIVASQDFTGSRVERCRTCTATAPTPRPPSAAPGRPAMAPRRASPRRPSCSSARSSVTTAAAPTR